jgi:hypothetical protein
VVRSAKTLRVSGRSPQRLFNIDGDILDLLKVGAENLDAENRSEAGGEHLGPRLNRHPENVRHARCPDIRVHLGDELFPRHAGPPLLVRLERDHRLKHR